MSAEGSDPLLARRVAATLWPAFLMAGVMEVLVFALVDPSNLHWLGGGQIEWPARAIYTLAFFAFWAVIACAGALTALLAPPPPADIAARGPAHAEHLDQP